MSIAQLYPSASSENNENLYLSLVRIAQVDGQVSEQEQALLNRIALRMGWNQEEQLRLQERASSAVVTPIIDAEERIERMYACSEWVISMEEWTMLSAVCFSVMPLH